MELLSPDADRAPDTNQQRTGEIVSTPACQPSVSRPALIEHGTLPLHCPNGFMRPLSHTSCEIRPTHPANFFKSC
jgi:hypothetical protein